MINTKRLKEFDRDWVYLPTKKVPVFWLNKKLGDTFVNEFLDYCLLWCYRTFGDVEGVDLPEIEWEWDNHVLRSAGMLALYDTRDNQITMRITGHRTIFNLSKSIVHEYTHYLQPRQGNWYERHDQIYGYENNPYEIEAYYMADLYGVECGNWAISQNLKVRK